MKKLIPKYATFPLIGALIINSIVYYGNLIFTSNLYHYNLSSKLDSIIPFCSIFIIFYILAYIYWIVGYILIARESKEMCYKYIGADIIAKMICLIIFIALPTTMNRATISGNSIFDYLIKLIYAHDKATNLFPSIHCLESWICFRGSIEIKKVPKGYSLFAFVLTILICLSTVFVKQHVFIDIIGGILTAEVGLFIAKAILKRKKNEAL